jgi:hypothetical protein
MISRHLSRTTPTAMCLAALVLGACGSSSDSNQSDARQDKHEAARPAKPTQQATAREFFEFATLGEMVATSSTVVTGTVTSLETGRAAGSGMDEEHYTNAVLHVDEQLAGAEAPLDLRIEELTSYAGDPIVLDGLEPSRIGDSGIYFLRRAEKGTYVLISSQGRFLQKGSDLSGSNAKDALVGRLQQMDKRSLVQSVKQADDKADSGQIKPVPGPPGLSR